MTGGLLIVEEEDVEDEGERLEENVSRVKWPTCNG